MTLEQAQGLLRAAIAGVGGYLVGKGIVDASTVTSVSGFAATALAAYWSYASKPKA